MNGPTPFSREAWDRNTHTYEIIRTMPFNAELAAGTLSEARFKHYVTQDAHYLIGFGRALTLAAAKAPSPERIVQFAKSAEGAIVVEVALGALLPCFWIYAEVGRDIHARAAPANPYQAWIDTYAGEEFHAAVRRVIAATDEAAAEASLPLRARMHAAFTRATQLEWIFWDSAFRLETWPI